MEILLNNNDEFRKTALFGTGGNPTAFRDEGYEKTPDMMKWLSERKLDSYEYQAGRGLSLNNAATKAIADSASEYNIKLSLHAPYFIALASLDEKKRLNSVGYIKQSVKAAEAMGAYLIVIHPGGFAKTEKAEAFKLACDTISKGVEELYKAGLTNIRLGLETMGQENQLGTLDDIIELCKIDAMLYPVVDFGHMYARSLGEEFITCDDYKRVFDEIGENLSDDHAKYLHCHFSKIEYTKKGEKKHLTFENKEFGPEFEPLAKVLAENNLYPNIICESDGAMDIDAGYMKRVYLDEINKNERE